MGWPARVLCAVLMVVATACLEPGLVPCGDQLCPVGSVCVANALCASPDQLAACDGVADGGTCSLRGGVGRCDRGACFPAGCGNGVVDPGELCDDSNTTGGDGCSADCSKVEVCGDGIVDDGEGCDDGNTNPADRCDACTPTTWSATTVIGGNANATSVGLALPMGFAVDRQGAVFIADALSHRILRVDATGVITTVAGSGTPGFSGDGGAATSAQLDGPGGVAVDGLGDLYIADTGNMRVRRVDQFGVITTIAGTGTQGFSGDGGLATNAQLALPLGVAVDGLGTLYIADRANNRIRRVGPTGVITTIAGTVTQGFSGDGGAATSAQLAIPTGVALDALGNVYIVDSDNDRIRRVDAAGVITTVAGNGTLGFSGDGGAATNAELFLGTTIAAGVAVDALGNLYIADAGNACIRRVDPTGVITTVAGTGTQGFSGDGGAALSAQLDSPTAVAIDGLGDLYVADAYNYRIRRVNSMGVITTIAGTGTFGDSGDGGAATSARLASPDGVAIDGNGNLYIADAFNARIRRVDPMGVITTVAGTGTQGFSGDGGAATSAQVTRPAAVAVDALGRVFIADPSNGRIRRIDASGIITTVAGSATAGFGGDGGAATSAQLNAPYGVAVDNLGNIYIADTNNSRIRRVDPTGIITTVAGNGTTGFGGDSGAATSAQLGYPSGVAVDNLGNLYIADTSNNRIRRVNSAGIITTVAGSATSGFGGDGGAATSAQLSAPSAVAVDGLANLYITDASNNSIRRVNAAGVITTCAGSGTFGFGGDGGPATTSLLAGPTAVAVDALGNLYVTPSVFSDNHVRRIDLAGVITTVAGTIAPAGMGPLAQAHLADPRAFDVTGPFTVFAGGSSGTVQVARSAPPAKLEVVAGRYPQPTAAGARARFRDQTFGVVSGVAYDAAAHVIYLTESPKNTLHVVTVVDPADANTWTIAPLANSSGISGFADGAAATARFRNPTGLYFDAAARQLYIADTGNHVIRAIDLASSVVRTVAGTPATRGFFGDGGPAAAALLFEPQAVTRCANGDLFIADTGNYRVRRIATGTNTISTVLGVGVPASSGEGRPASSFPVNTPLGLACDAIGNLYVTSTTTVRLVPADATGTVDGTGEVQTIYGAPPRDTFPASVTKCLTGLSIVDATTIEVTDSCTGLLVALSRTSAQ